MNDKPKTPREIMTEWWERSMVDRDCDSVEEYAGRVARRLRTLYGVEVPAGASLETIYEYVEKYDTIGE